MSGEFIVKDEREPLAFNPAILDDYGLDVYEFRTYMRLVRRAGSCAGLAFESIPNMAKAMKFSPNRVRQAIKVLLELSFVARRDSEPGESKVYGLLPVHSWVAREKYEELREKALEVDPARKPKRNPHATASVPLTPGVPPTGNVTPTPESGTPTPGELPPTPGVPKGTPLRYSQEGSPSKEKKENDNQFLPTSERINPLEVEPLLKNHEDQLAYTTCKSDDGAHSAAMAIIKFDLDVWHTLAKLKATSKPSKHAFRSWVVEILKNLQETNVENIKKALEITLQADMTFPYYRTVLQNLSNPTRNSGNATYSGRQKKNSTYTGKDLRERHNIVWDDGLGGA